MQDHLLKIRSKALAEEARITRREGNKLAAYSRHRRERQLPTTKLDRAREHIESYRSGELRSDARATFLARAFLKGMPLSAVESKCTVPANIQFRAEKIARRYGASRFRVEHWKAWIASEPSPTA